MCVLFIRISGITHIHRCSCSLAIPLCLQMTLQMEKFRENLEEFAAKHKNEIKKNPQFRKQFQEMCASIGVDPLASGKGKYRMVIRVLHTVFL